MTAFTTYTRNRLTNGEEPSVAAARATEATGQHFTCYDRQELEAEIEFLRRFGDIELNQQLIIEQQRQILDRIARLRGEVYRLTPTVAPEKFPTSAP